MDRNALFSLINTEPKITHASFVHGSVTENHGRLSFKSAHLGESEPYRVLGYFGLLNKDDEAEAFYLSCELAISPRLVVKNFHVESAAVNEGALLVPWVNVRIRFLRRRFEPVSLP